MNKRLIKIAVLIHILTSVSTSVAGLSPLGLRAASDACGGDLACMQKMTENFEERCANAKKRIAEDPSLTFYYKSILSMCDCNRDILEPIKQDSIFSNGSQEEVGSVFESNTDLGIEANDSVSSKKENDKLIEYLERSMKNDAELGKGYDALVDDASKISASLSEFNHGLDGRVKIQSKYLEGAQVRNSVSGDGCNEGRQDSKIDITSSSKRQKIIKQKLLEGKEDQLNIMGYSPKEVDIVWGNLSANEKTLYFERNYHMAARAIDVVKGVAVTPPVDVFLSAILNDELRVDKALKLMESSVLKKIKVLSKSSKELAAFYKKRGHSLSQEQIEKKIQTLSAGIKSYEASKQRADELESVLSRD